MEIGASGPLPEDSHGLQILTHAHTLPKQTLDPISNRLKPEKHLPGYLLCQVDFQYYYPWIYAVSLDGHFPLPLVATEPPMLNPIPPT